MITKKHLDQMRHAVGYHSDNPGYRNGFCTAKDDKIWTDLEDLGYAKGYENLGTHGFYVTDSGKELIGLEEQIRYKEDIDSQHRENIEYYQEEITDWENSF